VKYENMHDGAICQLDLDPENNWVITGKAYTRSHFSST